MSSYKHKIRKYKSKYNKLKNQLGNNNQKNYTFFFIHSTTVFENLLDILKTGVLYPGSYLSPERRQMCAECDDVYMNINFDDLQNIQWFHRYTLIFHPKIMYENGFIFNEGWGWAGPPEGTINIKKIDSKEEINHKLQIIHNFVENPILPEIILGFPATFHHQIVFDHPINLEGNLIGIACIYCDNISNEKPPDKQLKLIKKAIKNKPYANVSILTSNVPLPKLKDLIEPF